MNSLGFIGLLLVLYSLSCFWLAFGKPPWLWNQKTIQMYVKLMGEKWAVIFFTAFGVASLAAGIWLLIK